MVPGAIVKRLPSTSRQKSRAFLLGFVVGDTGLEPVTPSCRPLGGAVRKPAQPMERMQLSGLVVALVARLAVGLSRAGCCPGVW